MIQFSLVVSFCIHATGFPGQDIFCACLILHRGKKVDSLHDRPFDNFRTLESADQRFCAK